VVGSAKRWHRDKRSVGRQQAHNGMDPCHFERLLPCERWKNPRQAPSEHRLSGTRRTREQQVVRTGSSDLERPASSFLAAHVRHVGAGRSFEHVVRQRLEGRRVDLAAEVRDDLGQVANGNRLDARKCRLGCRFCRADQSSQPSASSSFGDRERAGHGPDSPVEGELTYRCVLREAFWRELTRRGENRERDRQIEARPLFPQGSRSKVDGDPSIERPFERRGHDPAPDSVFGLLAGSIGEPDDREPGDAWLQVRLDFHLPRLETYESMSDRACEHTADGRREGVTQG